MSFILDALKKSAAERQLGEVPSLQPAADISSTQKNKSWGWPLTSVLVLVLVLSAGYFWYTRAAAPADQRQVQNTSRVGTTAVDSRASGTEKLPDYHPQEKLPDYRPPEPGRSPLANYTPPLEIKPPLKKPPVLASTSEVIIKDKTEAATEADPDKPDAQNVSELKAQKALTEQQRIARLKAQRAAESKDDAALVAAVEKRLAAEKAAARKKSATASGAEKLQSNSLSLSELPAAVRSKIPDINISMQVYASEPADRFVIVDGKRYREKDQLAEGVSLDEILRQGLILKYRQYRVLIK